MKTSTKIAIQGGPASFHDAAARLLSSKESAIEILPCTTFRSLCQMLCAGEADLAVMAIENTLAGSLLPNYTLLQEHNLHISAEVWLPIDQCLMALPGQDIAEIHTVVSHPVALMQCSSFFNQYPHLTPQEAHDTADSAKAIREQQLSGTAAIASKAAAELYGLALLAENIADTPQNFTRFLLLHREQPDQTLTANKAILCFQKPLHTATLTLVLSLLQKHEVEVSLLQTLPAADSGNSLVAELEAATKEQLQEAIAQIRPLVEGLQALGILQKAELSVQKQTTAIL